MIIDKYFHLYGEKDSVNFVEIPKPTEPKTAECGKQEKGGRRMNEELEYLKAELENVIQGMTICASVLSADEKEYLLLFQRCKSVLDRIKPKESEKNETCN